jgi:hypothetical protein
MAMELTIMNTRGENPTYVATAQDHMTQGVNSLKKQPLPLKGDLLIFTPCETPLGKNPNKPLQLSAHMHPSPALFQARDMAAQALSCAFTL